MVRLHYTVTRQFGQWLEQSPTSQHLDMPFLGPLWPICNGRAVEMSISAVVHLVHVVVSGDYQAIVHRMSLCTHKNLRQEGQFVCANQLNGLQILRDLLCVVRMLKIH